MAPVDLSQLVVDAVSAARALGPDHPISLRVTDVAVLSADSARIRQVVDNLLANARTHTPPGTRITVTVGIEGERALLTVHDDGPGMPAEAAEHIFERFYRHDASRSRTSGGSGLGMSIVHSLVVAHGGSVEVDTAPGRGLTVRVRLPLIAPNGSAPGEQARAQGTARSLPA